MNRLIQGDVGSGKTDVAVAALLMAIGSEKTGALMAPTEILATQHFLKIKKALEPLGISVYLLKGKMKAAEKRETIEGIQKGPCIIIGTHALIEDPVMIENLGLVVVDEQHRFGVIQRLKIKKAQTPHCVFMTATPIPRTFMLTSFGDLDKTIIGELPPGRVPPTTFYMKESNVRKSYEHCRLQLAQGFQLYIVYPLVKESEKIDLQSAMEGFEEAKNIYKEFNVGLIHGKMSPDEKRTVMSQFKDNEIQVLVATTVIEVGIDVPNATMMIIHHAERFGLSQLHQLRGRIGRGGNESQCFLIAAPKTDTGKQRLKAMVNTTDGFELAETDLKIRGPGDMLGTKQSGLPDFKCGDIVRDESILLTARKVAKSLLDSDPKLDKPEHLGLKRAVESSESIVTEETLN
jgi:ATP-dependent DNA helicase RecG